MLPGLVRAHARHRVVYPAARALCTTSTPTPTPTAAPLSAADLELLLRRGHYSPSTRRFHSLLPLLSHPPLLLSSALHLSRRAHPSLPSPPQPPPITAAAVSSPSSHLRILLPSRLKGQPLAVPTLPLRLAMRSAASALDAVFSPRAATFSYRSRHTAVRYLRSIPSASWFFRVAIPRQPFGPRNVRSLLDAISGKVDDPGFLDFLNELFVSDAVSFELGGCELGRGLPQESELTATLVNIFFDPVDREVMAIREEVHKKHPRMKDDSVLHMPVRVYAVRYLDEILVVTSGSKMLTIDARDRIIAVLEKDLEVKVDRLGSSIHSAVSEKIEFLGMEFQAVLPSVLHPPMSEKAKRARKKYLKRKAAKMQELKNARETRRKKLGLKILNHLFKKVRRGHEFEFDFRIENEVQQVFKDWAEETVAEYFKSQEHCRYWHRLLTSGDFLSLPRVRDQLPHALVDSYDKFQETLDKLMPMLGHDMADEEEWLAEEEEEKQYEKRTLEDLTELKMRVNAPIELVRKAVKLAGFTNSMGRPQPIKLLLCLDDVDIIKWYAGVGRRWLDFFCCCRNFKMVKTVVSYHLRFSCFLTLAEKHECTKRQAISHFTKDLRVANDDGGAEVHFPTEREIKMMGDKNLSDPKPVDGTLTMILVRLAVDDASYPCLTHFCAKTDTVLYRIRLLQNRLNVDPLNEKKWVCGLSAIHESLNKKCLPLCSMHASDLLLGKITLQDIDCTQFVDVE
ncbi:nuclear intron maturase 3, mitochondrial-like [Phragmites australis]|uniref:nuclear intron maturase 3, mitochondrial-like n=1 Tax=Phragmites australis TaxID=29695 RepID=UPI002D7A3F37|nr:nuclear intron maturase 3, mitochondrial-like [Phragmites australis]